MSIPNLVRFGGLAAMLGGLIWIAKSSLIMLGIVDLGGLIIVAQLPFAFALLGLYLLVREPGGRTASIGGILACVAGALALVNTPSTLLEETPLLFNVTYLAAALAIFAGLMFLGVAVLRSGVLPPRWRTLPLALGVSSLLPVWVLAFVHVELPVLILGFAWTLLGYMLLVESGETVRLPSRTR